MNIPDNKYLGSLCKRGHDYEGTGKSLRYASGECFKCQHERRVEYFHKPQNKKHQQEYNREYRQRPESKERHREYVQKPEVVERQREYQREWRRKPENKEYHRKYSRKYYHKPEVKERQRERMLEYTRNSIGKLTDYYVRGLIMQSSPLTREDITQGLIDSYRICIIADRAVRAADVALKQHKEKVS